MKTILISILFGIFLPNYFINAQINANNFTWIKGSNIVDQTGFYGAAGNPLNTPGARQGAMTWIFNGKLYLFGGYGFDGTGETGYLNDLWEYNPITNNWNWIKGPSTVNTSGSFGTLGVSASTNLPQSRTDGATWAANEKLYLFGGFIRTGHEIGDLWEFNPITNNWTWIKGPDGFEQFGNYGTKGLEAQSNIPGSRTRAFSWEYNNDLYLFGGYGRAFEGFDGTLNDLWLFNTTTNNWTWIGGSNTLNQSGIYGTQEVGSISNIPGSRYGGVSCQIANKFYLFGGYGYPETGSTGQLNDLWEYNTLNGQWKYLKGDKTVNNKGVYNTQRIYNSTTKPGSRNSSSLLAYNNKLYLFGGTGWDIDAIFSSILNDLMIYDINTNNWVWQRGSENCCGNGSFGTQGVTNSTNRPSARSGHTSWYYNHKLYLFGGYGEASINEEEGNLNDLWSYVIPCDGSSEFYSIKNGNWNDPTVWSCGRVPENTASIGIKGHTITVNGNFGIRGIEFTGGNLVFPNMSTLTYYPIVP